MQPPKNLLNFNVLILTLVFTMGTTTAHPIDDYFKKHKNDHEMESKIVPPKIASQVVDKDYPEAIAILKSMSALRYLNYYGDLNQIKKYAKQALAAKGSYPLLLEKKEENRNIKVFGIKKNGLVRRLFAVVQSKTQFLLIIGKGKLSNTQVQYLPILAKEL
ncbi:hypothetical protein DNU06_01580 [Putridiphycobacter roseus]|uniref:DUF4252 domain-containing protein n=2 Tax=Putridiphycobacter roseus TaxID=2219161 RepID=A0A2W1N4P3_9FLAO|nr:DUF4252 domain-containing protein [Putridiphycobacter roseus]PZE18550.1 hypothetical protein DNU06_01580 [Putridiphycobacter roseus]